MASTHGPAVKSCLLKKAKINKGICNSPCVPSQSGSISGAPFLSLETEVRLRNVAEEGELHHTSLHIARPSAIHKARLTHLLALLRSEIQINDTWPCGCASLSVSIAYHPFGKLLVGWFSFRCAKLSLSATAAGLSPWFARFASPRQGGGNLIHLCMSALGCHRAQKSNCTVN